MAEIVHQESPAKKPYLNNIEVSELKKKYRGRKITDMGKTPDGKIYVKLAPRRGSRASF